MKRTFILFLFALFLTINLFGQPTISFDESRSEFTIENSMLKRVLALSDDKSKLYTKSYVVKNPDYDFWRENGTSEFSISINGARIECGEKAENTSYIDYKVIDNEGDSKNLRISLKGNTGSVAEGLVISLYYEIYNNSPVVRKWVTIKNNREESVVLTDLFVENLRLDPWGGAGADIFANYGRYWYKSPYVGGKDDPAVLMRGDKGTFILGNEAPGILKYTSLNFDGTNLMRIGMNPSGHPFPFQKSLKGGESFTSPKTFVLDT